VVIKAYIAYTALLHSFNKLYILRGILKAFYIVLVESLANSFLRPFLLIIAPLEIIIIYFYNFLL
jgi:hypothetical protein